MIRVSTLAQYQNGVSNISARQRELLDTQNRLSVGKRILTPADDPVGSGKAALLRSESTQFDQFADNQSHARSALEMTEGAMTAFIGAIEDVKDRLTQAGNGTLNNADRKTLASDLQGVLDRMVGLANSSDGNGGFLFAGSKTGTAPFAVSGSNVSYLGDGVAQSVEVSQDRFQQVKIAGDELFMKVRPGNGTFVTAPAGGNTGSGVIDIGTVVNPSAVTGNAYAITFSVSGGATTYTVQNTTTSTTVASGPFTNPGSLSFDGMQMGITGAPANGDTFNVTAAAPQSIFKGMADAIALLQGGFNGQATQAQYSSGLMALSATMDASLAHVNVQRADVGNRQAELDAYETINDGRKVDFASRLSNIEDLDIAKGASELAQRQTTFQAALQSYSSVSKLSLFNFM